MGEYDSSYKSLGLKDTRGRMSDLQWQEFRVKAKRLHPDAQYESNLGQFELMRLLGVDERDWYGWSQPPYPLGTAGKEAERAIAEQDGDLAKRLREIAMGGNLLHFVLSERGGTVEGIDRLVGMALLGLAKETFAQNIRTGLRGFVRYSPLPELAWEERLVDVVVESWAESKPVVAGYVFCPNYDPLTDNKLSADISHYRKDRAKNIHQVRESLRKQGIDMELVLLYEDHVLTHKVDMGLTDPVGREEELEKSFRAVKRELLKYGWDVVRLTQQPGFGVYEHYFEVAKGLLIAGSQSDQGLEEMAARARSSDSRHRIGLDESVHYVEAVRRAAQAYATRRWFLDHLGVDIVLTNESGEAELAPYAWSLGNDGEFNRGVVINLKKKEED